MSRLRVLFFCLIIFTLSFSSAYAGDVLFEVSQPLSGWTDSSFWGRGTFTASDGVSIKYKPISNQNVCMVKHGVYKFGTPTDNLILKIYEGGSMPGSGNLKSFVSVPASQVGGSATAYTSFMLSPCLTLTVGTNYFFVFSRSSLNSTNGYISRFANQNIAPETSYWSNDRFNSPNWTEYLNRDFSFRLEGPDEPEKTPVLIIPGIAGSELYNGDDLIWADLSQMFLDVNDQFLSENLVLDENGESVNQIIASRAIEQIPDIPVIDAGAFNVDTFKSLREDLESSDYSLNQDLFYFPYDWRLNLDNSKDLLNAKIEEIKLQTGFAKVNIIAHSMGGLLAKDYLNSYGKNSIDKLIFVGTPHLGAPKSARVLLAGDNMGIPWLNGDRVKEVVHNSPATYELLPTSSYFNNFQGYIQKAGSDDFLNLQDSNSFLLGNNLSANIMSMADNFWSKNLENTDFSGIDAYNIVGCSNGTEASYLFKTDDISINKIGYTSGDKTVPLVSSDNINLPAGNKFYLKKANHAEMPSQEDVRAAILNILSDKPASPSGNLKNDSSACNFKGKELSWHSPVAVHIYDSQDRHTGPIENDGIENSIPGVNYQIIGHDKFIFLPTNNGENYNVIADGLATGSFDFLISENDNGTLGNTTVFNDVPLGESGDVSFTVSDSSTDSNINVDYYGNNLIQIVSASSVLSGDEAFDVVSPETQATTTGQAGSSGWYLGEVTIGLLASDDNSGVLETKYSLDGRPFEVYNGPAIVTDEGMHTILYYSVDRAGNNELVKDVSFGIDMTGLEISVSFDLDSEKFLFAPVGDSLENVSFLCDLISCTATDKAGNTTKLEFTFEQNGRKQFLNFSSVSYNGIENGIPDNQFTVKLSEKNEELKDFDQTFLVKKEEKIKIDYKKKRDESIIVHRLIPAKPTRETISGKHFLQIFTEKGKIDYIIL